eukprot:Tamp_21186.p1 GENE.Tamp_21186~~Tamp_21186.p1  ORF type:complete len:309 (-),score=17.98 Tamp_21186:231-1040(-)
MDLLFILAVPRSVPSRNGYFVKLPALRLALAEYQSVAWIDMDGFAPFMPRPETRKCVPFTRCWPSDTQVVISMSPVPPRFPITSLFLLFRGDLTDALLDLAWTPKDSTDQTSIQDALLLLMDANGSFRYQGECSRGSSVQDQCWIDAVRDQHVSTSPLPGLYLSGAWCVADSVSNVTLTCPCLAPGPQADWCVPNEAEKASNAGHVTGPCSVTNCLAHETLFVHFGTWQMQARAHEIRVNNAWSCARTPAARRRSGGNGASDAGADGGP